MLAVTTLAVLAVVLGRRAVVAQKTHAAARRRHQERIRDLEARWVDEQLGLAEEAGVFGLAIDPPDAGPYCPACRETFPTWKNLEFHEMALPSPDALDVYRHLAAQVERSAELAGIELPHIEVRAACYRVIELKVASSPGDLAAEQWAHDLVHEYLGMTRAVRGGEAGQWSLLLDAKAVIALYQDATGAYGPDAQG